MKTIYHTQTSICKERTKTTKERLKYPIRKQHQRIKFQETYDQ